MPLPSTYVTTALGNGMCGPDPSTGREENPGLLLHRAWPHSLAGDLVPLAGTITAPTSDDSADLPSRIRTHGS